MRIIERPDWKNITVHSTQVGGWYCSDEINKNLNDWFDKHVEPINKMLSKAVEVQSGNKESLHWSAYDVREATHKALLINIEPIVKDTVEIVLRDMTNTLINGTEHDFKAVLERAKKVLEAES